MTPAKENKMTKAEKELKKMGARELLGEFDNATQKVSIECNTKRGLTKATHLRYELAKRELLNRLGVEYEIFSEKIQ